MEDLRKSAALSTPANRLGGIDAFRVFALIAVVLLHSFQPATDAPLDGGILLYFARWAVPFFFIVSGYFFGLRDPGTVDGIIKLAKRLTPVILFWLLVYIVYFKKTFVLTDPIAICKYLFTGGMAFHLWFLSALAISGAVVLCVKRFGLAVLFTVAALLYLFGLGFGAYRELLSLPEIPWGNQAFKTRWGPFLGVLFIAAGYYLGRKGVKTSLRTGLYITIFGAFLQLAEAYLIWSNGYDFSYEFLFGTVPFGIGMFLVALNLNEGKFLTMLAPLGQAVLGAYCIHLIFLDLLSPHFDQTCLSQGVVLGAIVFILSLVASYLMSKIPYLHRVVK